VSSIAGFGVSETLMANEDGEDTSITTALDGAQPYSSTGITPLRRKRKTEQANSSGATAKGTIRRKVGRPGGVASSSFYVIPTTSNGDSDRNVNTGVDILQRICEKFNAGDMHGLEGVLASTFADNVAFHFLFNGVLNKMYSGRDKIREFHEMLLETNPDALLMQKNFATRQEAGYIVTKVKYLFTGTAFTRGRFPAFFELAEMPPITELMDLSRKGLSEVAILEQRNSLLNADGKMVTKRVKGIIEIMVDKKTSKVASYRNMCRVTDFNEGYTGM
jgi:hypothetical protein